MALSRRQFLRTAALFGAGGTALSGCGSFVASGLTGSEGDPRTVGYWNLFSGGDGVRMQEMLSAFAQQHPDLDVDAATLEWGSPFYTKVALATIGEQPPHVASAHLTRVTPLARAGLLQELHSADLAQYGLTPEKFVDRAWEQAHVDGKLYAIPLDTHPFVCFYNTDICEKAGLLDSSGELVPPRGRDGLVSALRAAKEAGAQWGGAVATIVDTSTSWRFFQTLYSQAGGRPLLEERGNRVTIDEDIAVDVLGFMRNLTIEEQLMPRDMDYGGAVAAFADGKAGFYFQGEWEISTFQDAGTPFSMTRFPHVYLERDYIVQADSHAFVLPVWPAADSRRLDAALTFVRGMLDESLTWAKGGHVPVWLPVQDSSAYRELEPQSNYADVARRAVYDPPAWYSGSGSEFEDAVGAAVSAVFSGESEPRAAVRAIRAELEGLADTPSPIV